MNWKDTPKGPWAFTKQESVEGYVNNPDFVEKALATRVHTPCGYWSKRGGGGGGRPTIEGLWLAYVVEYTDPDTGLSAEGWVMADEDLKPLFFTPPNGVVLQTAVDTAQITSDSNGSPTTAYTDTTGPSGVSDVSVSIYPDHTTPPTTYSGISQLAVTTQNYEATGTISNNNTQLKTYTNTSNYSYTNDPNPTVLSAVFPDVIHVYYEQMMGIWVLDHHEPGTLIGIANADHKYFEQHASGEELVTGACGVSGLYHTHITKLNYNASGDEQHTPFGSTNVSVDGSGNYAGGGDLPNFQQAGLIPIPVTESSFNVTNNVEYTFSGTVDPAITICGSAVISASNFGVPQLIVTARNETVSGSCTVTNGHLTSGDFGRTNKSVSLGLTESAYDLYNIVQISMVEGFTINKPVRAQGYSLGSGDGHQVIIGHWLETSYTSQQISNFGIWNGGDYWSYQAYVADGFVDGYTSNTQGDTSKYFVYSCIFGVPGIAKHRVVRVKEILIDGVYTHYISVDGTNYKAKKKLIAVDYGRTEPMEEPPVVTPHGWYTVMGPDFWILDAGTWDGTKYTSSPSGSWQDIYLRPVVGAITDGRPTKIKVTFTGGGTRWTELDVVGDLAWFGWDESYVSERELVINPGTEPNKLYNIELYSYTVTNPGYENSVTPIVVTAIEIYFP